LPQRGLYVDGLSQEPVACASEVLDVVRAGSRLRSVATTRQNQHSSRSHAVLVLTVEQRLREGTERMGKLTLVDLAGSEKVSKSECVGETLEEAKKINWSLTALGKVIDALAEQRPHVPYRDSRLTRVLEEALGGNCRTTLLVAASACSQHYDETLSSLRFATRAKKVRNHAKVNYVYSSDQLLQLVAQLQLDLARARRQVAASCGVPCAGLPSSRRARGRLGQDAGSLRLAYSGSAPALGQGRVLLDMDETFCMFGEAPHECCLTPPPEEAADGYGSEDFDCTPDPEDEAWRPLALAARDAVLSMEAALVWQERALDEVELLPAQMVEQQRTASLGSATGRSGSNVSAPVEGGGDAQSTVPSMEVLAERFRALRHAVDTRGLRWRLQAEQRRAGALELELELRTRYTEELERDLEQQATARPSELLRGGPLRTDEGLGESLRRAPACQRGPAAPSSASSSSTASLARGSASPGPRGASVQARGARPGQRLGRAATAEGRIQPVPVLQRTGQDSSAASTASSSRLTALSSPLSSPVQAKGMPSGSLSEGAGEGEVLSCGGDIWAMACVGDPSVGSPERKPVRQLPDAEVQRELAAMEQLHETLKARVEQLQAEVDRKGQQLADIAVEVGCLGVSSSALRHEVRVKGALLGQLQDEAFRKEEEDEAVVERLMSKALATLATIVSPEQLAVASAEGERVALVGG